MQNKCFWTWIKNEKSLLPGLVLSTGDIFIIKIQNKLEKNGF